MIFTMNYNYKFLKKNALNVFKFSILFTVFSCATYKVQTGKDLKNPVGKVNFSENEVDHTFYLVGDAGNADEFNSQHALYPLKKQLDAASKNSTLIYLGDNVYPVGMNAVKESEAYKEAAIILENQLKISENFKGNVFMIPGNHDWYSGLEGLHAQEDFVANYLKNDKSYTPQNGCPIEDIEINDNITLITIDSQWYLEDWDKYPTINDDCDIKSREAFFLELESEINKNEDKRVIIALHHPLFTNGVHGGHFGVKKMLLSAEKSIPLPLVGSLYNLLRKTSGVSNQDVLNKQYNELTKRIRTLIQDKKNVVVVSGHEHSLEYIERDNIKQVVSGSGTKTDAVRAIYPKDFSYGRNGFAKLQILKDGRTILSFFGKENNEEVVLYKQEILPAVNTDVKDYPDTFPEYVQASIYDPKDTIKSGFYRFLWGNHYRKYYGIPIKAKVATLDQLYGGVTPDRKGGGHQTNSLRVIDKNENEYVLRGLKKSATRFFQAAVFKDHYIEEELQDTYVESFLMDFYTTANPFTPFIIDDLEKSINLYHTNPKLYYIPKHDALGKFNSSFGNQLYMVEERPSDSQTDKNFFGKPDDIIGSDDLLEKLRKDEKYRVDEPTFIRARLFDMLIGDWDRHSDQWKWSEFKLNENDVVYKPIPKDRDQAFPKYGGSLLSVILTLPEFKKMQSYDDDIANIKHFNVSGYEMDLALLQENKWTDWETQVQYIQTNLTDENIDRAFAQLPAEILDETTKELKENLKSRRDKLLNFAKRYYKILEHKPMIVGTDKKEDFIIKKLNKNEIEVVQIRDKKDGKEQFIMKRKFNAKLTKEVWIYGLDDDDTFKIEGDFPSKIKIRLIGGQNNDSYKIENGNNVIVYDYKTKDNEFDLDGKTRKRLSNNYEMNVYSPKKAKFSSTYILPTIGFNPDDGVKLGGSFNYIYNGFRQNPYTSKHNFTGNYYFATSGFELLYNGHFPKLLGKFDLELKAQATSENFAMNFFGFGNDSYYPDKEVDNIDFDYNRVKMRKLNVFPVIKRVGEKGSETGLTLGYENIQIQETPNRFISEYNAVNDDVFETNQFGSAKLSYGYENYDNNSLPTMGMGFLLSGEWKSNLVETNRNFFTLESKFNFSHKITTNGKLVYETLFRGKIITNDNFEFYQGADIGGNNGLRAYRNERFLGRKSFYQTSDVRLTLGTIKKSLFPMRYGVIAGFDYGRVWLNNDNSNTWHTSYGGMLWLNGMNTITAKVGYFMSPIDNGRFSFAMQFGF